jgi:hypothetical protein
MMTAMTSLASLAHAVAAGLQRPVLRHYRNHHPGPVPRTDPPGNNLRPRPPRVPQRYKGRIHVGSGLAIHRNAFRRQCAADDPHADPARGRRRRGPRYLRAVPAAGQRKHPAPRPLVGHHPYLRHRRRTDHLERNRLRRSTQSPSASHPGAASGASQQARPSAPDRTSPHAETSRQKRAKRRALEDRFARPCKRQRMPGMSESLRRTENSGGVQGR